MGRAKPTLALKLLRAVESERFKAPIAWSVFCRYPTAELRIQYPKPPRISFSDHSLYQDLYASYPQVRLQAFVLNSPHPSLARRFVERQLQLMREGLEKKAAFRAAELEMVKELEGAEQGQAMFIEHIQADEEELLINALKEIKGKKSSSSSSSPSSDGV